LCSTLKHKLEMKLLLVIIAAIAVTIGIVWLINKFVPEKIKWLVQLALWAFIIVFGYLTFMSVYKPIQFNKEKDKRYVKVIKNLEDIRTAQLAHRQVTGKFSNNFDSLVNFIETANFTILQRKDSTVVDKELTRRYGGVTTTKEIVVIDTLGFVPVKDSLFKNNDNYKTMMNVPVGKPGAKFTLKAGTLEDIAVFEASVDKAIVLDGEDKDLITVERQAQSVDAVNGPVIKVGSMEQVDTNGNWPKVYENNDN